MHNEEDAGSETEDHENSMPELIVRNRGLCADSMGSDRDASTSVKIMPKLLTRKKNAEDTNLENEQEWENLDDTDDEAYDVQDASVSKSKKKPLGSETLLSAKTKENECVTLLGLVDAGSSRSLGKREAMQTIKDVKITADEKIKWKTKAGVLETKEPAQVWNMTLPQLTKRREFDTEKLHSCDEPEEKCNIIVGRDDCQNIGLSILNSTQQFQWHENLINMMPAEHQKDKKNSFKKLAGNIDESQIEEAEEEHDMTKTSENKHKKIDFDEELAKKSHLNSEEKGKLMAVWKKHKDLFKGKVGHHTNSEAKLHFKKGQAKCISANPMALRKPTKN